MTDIPLGDGFTTAHVDGPLDPSLPLVVLLHGLGGSSLDMTDPLSAYGSVSFDRTATFPLFEDAGFSFTPPLLPVNGFFLDPPATALTSWRTALLQAGFSTVTYNQSGVTIAQDVTQLTTLALGPLSSQPAGLKLDGMRIAFVGHSRGGVLARAFLVAAAATPALAAFLGRVTSVVTLHSPHVGSGLANLAGTVDGLLAQVMTIMATMGIPPPGLLTMLRSRTGNPAVAELMVGSSILAGIAAAEPVGGVTYHTFGGTSTVFARLWAKVFTPDSTIPLPVPFPLFHHGTTPVPVGAPLDAVSFAPTLVVPVPVITELATTLGVLAATTPELRQGAGDGLVSDARAHLLFSATRTTNALNHLEALADRTLQAQVVAILARLRTPGVSGQAVAQISPFPVSRTRRSYTVTAADAVSGQALTQGTVTVFDTFGSVALTTGLGSPFTFAFVPRRTVTVAPDGEREVALVFPSVSVSLPAPYGVVGVEIGLG
jgi:pimeloyl-ACP methyl ester carboxylesterase